MDKGEFLLGAILGAAIVFLGAMWFWPRMPAEERDLARQATYWEWQAMKHQKHAVDARALLELCKAEVK